jgi:hypothetical protein
MVRQLPALASCRAGKPKEALVHTSEADAATTSAPPPKPKWAFARESFPCGRCHDVIGQGEAYRVSTNPKRFGLCEGCSLAIDPTHGAVPEHIEDRSPLEALRDELSLRQASRQPDFVKLDTPAARAAWKKEGRPKPSATMEFGKGMQPYEDPRGQGRNRHGVATAVRNSIERDYRRAQAGERDE